MFRSTSIHDYGKDGDVYIFPGCIANVSWKLLNKDDTRSPNEKFWQNKYIDLLPYVFLSLS